MKKLLLFLLLCGVSVAHAAPTPSAETLQLEAAIAKNDVEGAKKLIAAPTFSPVAPSSVNEGRATLFEAAIRANRGTIARLMMASPRFKTAKWTPDFTSSALIETSQYPAMLLMVQDLAKIPAFDVSTPGARGGVTFLSFAANHDNVALVKWLLSQPKVNPAASWRNGTTALHMAGAKTTALLLSTRKVDVNAREKDYGDTPLHHATGAGNVVKMRLLLASPKIQPNLLNTEGQSALDLALSRDAEFCKALMSSKKVKVSAKQRQKYRDLVKNGNGAFG